ncbi:MAG: hypothetical protein ACK5NK_06115 [Niabella sp.]
MMKFLLSLLLIVFVTIINNPLSAQSVDCTISATNPDSDGDGVSDACDLDDDNDGILDTAEGYYNTEFAGNNSNPTGTPGSVFISYPFGIENPVGSGNWTYGYNPTRSNLAGIMNPASVTSITSGGGFDTTITTAASLRLTNINAATLTEAKTNSEYLEYKFTTQDVHFYGIIDWVGIYNRLNTNPAYTTTFSISSDNFVSNSTDLGTIAQIAGEGGGGSYPIGRRALDISDYTLLRNTTYTIRIYVYNVGGPSVQLDFDDPIIAFDYAILDTDGDGTFDYLDWDSDGDGCADAIEGSADFRQNDLKTSTTAVNFQLVNSVNTTTGVPLGTGLPQGIGVSRDPLVNFCNIILPVHYGAITAVRNGSSLVLNWETLIEQNNDHFEIEASTDGKTFTKIGELNSKAVDGNSNELISYSFVKTGMSTSLGVSALAVSFLLVLFQRNNREKVYSVVVLIAGVSIFMIACNKPSSEVIEGKKETVYVKIAQIDKDGTKTYSRIITAVNE